MGSSHTSRARTRTRSLAPGAAVAAWVGILVALNLTSHPLVAGAAFVGLAWLAIVAGKQRLLVISVLVGAGMLLVLPGFALADGSFSFSYGSNVWHAPHGAEEWIAALGSCLRIPAQVLASALFLLVPAPRLLAAAGRFSARTSLLGGLVARLQQLLARDIRLVRDELLSQGLRMRRPAPIGERLAATFALWDAMLSGMLDRAFQTAAALETRGFGVARPTVDPIADPVLGARSAHNRLLDRSLPLVAAVLVGGVLGARASGALAAPAIQVFGGIDEPVTGAVVVVALLAFAIGALPAVLVVDERRTPTRSAHATVAPQALAVPPQLGVSALTLDAVTMAYPSTSPTTPDLAIAGLTLRRGELVVATGPSGSGKSTLLDVITGVAPAATGGERRGVIRLGTAIVRSAHDAKGCIAAVFQDPEGQVLVGNVAEEVAFGLRHAGVAIAEIERRVRATLDELDVLHLAGRDCATLSGGELQRVLLAAALVLQPDVLILDEPTSQIDAASERRFWDAVDRVRAERGIAVLAAEHRLDHVLTRCDRVLVFDQGRIAAELTPAQVSELAPAMLASPYADLVPALPAREAPSRLQVRFDRLAITTATGHERVLLRNLVAAYPARSIVTLEGPNGTGKSTLLRSIRGLHASSGVVAVDGRIRGDVGASARTLAYLSQGAGAMLPGRSVRAASEATCRRLGIDVVHARLALAAAGLEHRHGAHPSELSVGERQRLALVAATAHRPPVWLLDEPTRGMDAAARRWVACHVLAHASSGGVVIVATHDSALAAAIATHRLRLDVRTGPASFEVARDAAGRVLPDVDPGRSVDGTIASDEVHQ